MHITQFDMDPALCRKAAYSNDYYDIIIDYIGVYPISDPTCIQRVDDKYDIGYYRREGIPELNLQDYPYQTIPKCFALMDQSALEASGILRLQNPAGLDLQGQGVLIGFVDTGIDYTNPLFCNEDGSTRILGIWDQTIEDGTGPDGFFYGGFYGEAAINEALRSDDPYEKVPSRDEIGHGTFLAGVAAGGTDAASDFTGAAPLSSLLVVKCKQAKPYLRDYYFIPDEVPCYQENDLMLGLSWLNQYANMMQMPLVICIGMGTSMGAHGGNEPVCILADELGRLRQRAVTVAAGNEANMRHHYFQSGLAENQKDTIEISVGENVSGFYMEFWASIPEIYRLSVISPTGERLPGIGGGLTARQTYTFLFERTTLTVDYAIAGARLGAQLIYLRFENPLAGIWSVEVSPEQIIEGSYNCWLPLTPLLDGEVFFLRSNPDTTILAPGMAPVAITVGAYQANGGSIYPDTGRGYSTQGAIKPEVLAPGVNVYGPLLRGGFGTLTGTSVSAAVAAGGCAQIFQWGVVQNHMRYLNSADLSNLLVRGAIRSPDRTYPNTSYGYGLMDVYQALERLRPR